MTINQLHVEDQGTAIPGGVGAFSPTSHLQHLEELRADAAADRLGRQLLRQRRAEARAARAARREIRREIRREARRDTRRGAARSPEVSRAGHASGRG